MSFDNGISVTQKIRTMSSGTIDNRSIGFKTVGASNITLCVANISDSSNRKMAIWSSDGKIVQWGEVEASSSKILTFSIDAPGEYYIASVSGGLEIGYIEIQEYYTPILNGTWKSLESINNPQENINDIEKATYTRDNTGSTYYANVDVYDYYSDWELTGQSLYDITYETYGEEDGYYNLQGLIYNKSISEYFRELDTTGTAEPLYFGGLKKSPNVGVTEYLQKNLYNGDTKANNTTVSAAVQGLVEASLNGAKNVTLKGIEIPYFDKNFLEGDNYIGTTIGKVYENVEFPFVMNEETGYWEFVSAEAEQTILLKEDSATGNYFFDKVGADEAIIRSDTPNFFPLTNVTASGDGKESNKNNFFGMEMKLKFSLSSDGKVNFYDDEGNVISKDIVFNFSGDDDVWIYIDGKQVLDIGGTHQKIAGTIDFATGYSAITYATEDGSTAIGDKDIATFEKAVANGISSEDIITGEDGNLYLVYDTGTVDEEGNAVEYQYLANTFDATSLLDGQEHTLTMFYMERGSFSSNMKISFNFPIQDFLEVSNEVDTSAANEMFADALANLPDIEFIIKTLATIGDPLSVDKVGEVIGFEKDDTQISDYGSISDSNTSNGLQLVSGVEYSKTTSGGTTTETEIENGSVIINDGEKVAFSDKFRTGSYIQIAENVSDSFKNAFKTTWEITQENSKITTIGTGNSVDTTNAVVSGEGYITDDNREINSSYISVDSVTVPEDGAIVYRNYVSPDSASKIDLEVEYLNTLKVGTITLEKQVLGDNVDETYEYEFLIEFTNVAGMNLEESPITKNVKLKSGETTTISGIPVGTEYKITEVLDMALEEITYDTQVHTNLNVEDASITGTVAETNSETEQKITFVNNDITKGYGSIEITKVDKEDNNKKLSGATFKLEKLVLDSENEERIIDSTFTAVEVTTGEDGIAKFENLDFGKYQISEIKAPDGYSLTNEVIEVEINLENLKEILTITNKTKNALPSAGASGMLFMIPLMGVIIFAITVRMIARTPRRIRR